MTKLQNIFSNSTSQDSYLIIGLGVTGKAIARFFEQTNRYYYIFDEQDNLDYTGKYFKGFLSKNDSPTSIKAAFLSPGISLKNSFVQGLQIPIFSELELASVFLKGKLIGVTGTNGKSTVVSLIYELLKNANVNVGLYGNIGDPLIDAVLQDEKDYYVIEESSYQLELVGEIHHKIAVCLNVTDDHLDRYENIQQYAKAKSQIIKNSQSSDYFIYNYDDKWTLQMGQKASCQTFPYSLVQNFEQGAFEQDQSLKIKILDKTFTFSLHDCQLKGLHNFENMLAALSVVLHIQDDENSVQSYRQTLKEFRGLSHRMEKVFSHNGIEFYDDSKATNVGAVVMALASFSKNVILLMGGKDKEGDYSPLKGLMQAKVKKLIVFGEAKNIIEKAFTGCCEIEKVETLKDAMTFIAKIVTSGDSVLLSPGCASFDQYKNYKERGKDFQNLVQDIWNL